MIRFVFLFLSLACSYSFAEANYRKELENFAQSLVFDKYHSLYELQDDERLSVKSAPLDKRINYPECITGLTGEVIKNSIKSTTSVKVTCADETPWTTYLRVRVKLLKQAVVVSRSLSKGQVLNSENIAIVYMSKSQIRNGSFSSLENLYGARLKRNLNSNKIIKNRDVCYVCTGDKVTIKATKTGLSIKASGIALSDANIGGTVRVKNSRTKRIVVGTVSNLKEVKISF
ncbi:flagellar basal body P-ring formation chaperone FlgA [Psychromonas sp. psych-6C06]|uniref:flagellar basal body P-ring formation chaperone FlgA n=1 Tax=Psychromonas sp. psych-6C06 TaxID=2058089 RepID=UPI001EE73D46|nr:flagellar basal body P-ring formation chaperone FlgA [Psychromonas sp. psych-6C06]